MGTEILFKGGGKVQVHNDYETVKKDYLASRNVEYESLYGKVFVVTSQVISFKESF